MQGVLRTQSPSPWKPTLLLVIVLVLAMAPSLIPPEAAEGLGLVLLLVLISAVLIAQLLYDSFYKRNALTQSPFSPPFYSEIKGPRWGLFIMLVLFIFLYALLREKPEEE